MYKTHKLILLPTDKQSFLYLQNRPIKQLLYNCRETVGLTTDTQPFNLYLLSDEKIEEANYVIKNGVVFKVNSRNAVSHTFNITLKYAQKYLKKIIATTDSSLTHLIIDPRPMISKVVKSLPQFQQSFINYYIKEYNNGNIIEEVEVGYDLYSLSHTYHNSILFESHLPEIIKIVQKWIKNKTPIRLKNKDKYGVITKINHLANCDFLIDGKMEVGAANWFVIDTLKINSDNTINIKPIKDSYSREEVEHLLHNATLEAIEQGESFNFWNWLKQNL